MSSKICALVLMTTISLVFGEEQNLSQMQNLDNRYISNVLLSQGISNVNVIIKAEDDPFTFDYHRLRVGGLILAAVLCLIGITILFSGHCRCKFKPDKSRRRAGSNTKEMLNDQGRACDC